MTEPAPTPDNSTLADNRRSAERRECLIEAAIVDARRAFLPAKVLDLSAGGVKLLVEPPPAPGETVQLTFLAHDGRLFQIAATVVHYVEHGKTWALGCRFARELSDDELLSIS
jgi:PilZ domain